MAARVSHIIYIYIHIYVWLQAIAKNMPMMLMRPAWCFSGKTFRIEMVAPWLSLLDTCHDLQISLIETGTQSVFPNRNIGFSLGWSIHKFPKSIGAQVVKLGAPTTHRSPFFVIYCLSISRSGAGFGFEPKKNDECLKLIFPAQQEPRFTPRVF